MISFIIPVYNKGAVLFKTLTSLLKRLKNQDIADFEIILVNDGSTDNSLEEAIRFKRFNGDTSKFKIFHYTKNAGKGFALKFGFSRSVGDPVIFIDGDLDIDASYIIKALNAYQKHNPDIVLASKYHPKSRTYYPFLRYLYSLILRFVIKSMFNLSVTDTQVGLKVFRRQVLSEVFPKVVIKRFAVDLELLIVAGLSGFNQIEEVAVVINQGSSRTSTIDIWAANNFCQDILALFYRKNILRYYSHKNAHHLHEPSLMVQTA